VPSEWRHRIAPERSDLILVNKAPVEELRFHRHLQERMPPKALSTPSKLPATSSTTPATPSVPSVVAAIPPSAPLPRYRPTPRSLAEASVAVVPTKKEDRAMLSASDQNKLRREAVESLNIKFQLTSFTNTENQLGVVHNLGMRVYDLRQRLTNFDMLECFQVITPNPADPNAPLAITDLMAKYADISLSDVRAHVSFLKFYGRTYDRENLAWTQSLLENSCEADLCERVMEQTLGISPLEMGGPTYFVIMMRTVCCHSRKKRYAI